MPAIPIAEIPNAPQLVGPVLADAPRARTDTAGIAKTLLTPTLQQGAFDGAAQGVQAIAEGLQGFGRSGEKAGAMLQDYEAKRTRANDVTALAQRDAVRTQWFADFSAKNTGRPEGEWVSNFDKALPELEKLQAQYPISEHSAPEAMADQVGWIAKQRAVLTVTSAEQAFKRGGDEVINAFRRNMEAGNFDEAFSILNKGRNSMLVPDAVADGLEFEGREKIRENSLYAAMNQNPKAFYEDTRELMKTGKSEVLGESIKTPQEAQMWASRAESNWRGIQSETRQNIFDRIASNDITREDQIAAEAGDTLDAKDLQAAKKMLMNQVGPLDMAEYANLRADVAGYDPKTDANKTKFADLQRRIANNMPSQEGQILFKELKGLGKEKTPRQEIDSFVKGQIKKLHDDQFWRQWETGKGDKKKVNRELEGESAVEMSRLLDAWDQWQKQNPEADFVQSQEWFNTAIKPDRETSVGWFQRFSQPSALREGKSLPWGAQTSGQLLRDTIFGGTRPTTESRMNAVDQKLGKPQASASKLGGVLAGKESLFDAAAEKYGVDPALLKAIAMHETGNGTSNAVKNRNNPGGLMNPKNYDEIQSFDSLDAGIEAMARNLGRNYIGQGLTSIQAIQRKYAPVGAKNDPRGLNSD